MSIYSVFIYEKHNLQDYRPDWMNTERYDYCEQSGNSVAPRGLLKNLFSRLSANR